VAGGKTADVIAALKWMETVRPGADERWIIVSPSVRPIATENVAYRDSEIIGNNQAETRDKQCLLPAQK
jgi:2-C-methyl-D-erythritol 4-phosphate cytidylyltransferase